MKDLYTIILDFRGGTYISQINEDNEHSALLKWRSSIDDYVPELNSTDKESIKNNVEVTLTRVTGLINVCCTTLIVNDSLALINIVKTHSS